MTRALCRCSQCDPGRMLTLNTIRKHRDKDINLVSNSEISPDLRKQIQIYIDQNNQTIRTPGLHLQATYEHDLGDDFGMTMTGLPAKICD